MSVKVTVQVGSVAHECYAPDERDSVVDVINHAAERVLNIVYPDLETPGGDQARWEEGQRERTDG